MAPAAAPQASPATLGEPASPAPEGPPATALPTSAAQRDTARLLLDRIAAQKRAASFREVRSRFAGLNDTLLATAREKFGVAAPFGGPTSSGMLTLHCPPEYVHALASFLREHGAEAVSVGALDYVYTRDNPLYAKLAAELDRPARPYRCRAIVVK